MVRLLFRRLSGIGQNQIGRNHKARSRRLAPRVDGLETRNLMTGGTVVQSGVLGKCHAHVGRNQHHDRLRIKSTAAPRCST